MARAGEQRAGRGDAAADGAFEGGWVVGADVVAGQPEAVQGSGRGRARQVWRAGEGGAPFANAAHPVRSRQATAEAGFEFFVQDGRERRVGEVVPGALRAHDEGQAAGGVAQLAAVEDPLPEAAPKPAGQAQHRLGQGEFGRVVGVERADRFKGVARELGGDGCGLRQRSEQAGGVLGGNGEDDVVEIRVVEQRREGVDAAAATDVASVRSDEGGCGLGKQAAEVGGREQQVGVGPRTAQAVAAADLRNETRFATLDYSESPPLLFVGEAVRFDTLKMTNLRDGAAPTVTVQAQVFRCPGCGSPMQARSRDILAVGCASCGTVVDTADRNYKVLSRARQGEREQYVPRLPLGSKGVLEDKPVEVIGFLVRRCKVEGIAYTWREYLLAGEHGTYRWLTEYNGHWNIVDVLSRPPATSGIVEVDSLRFGGQVFKHFSTTPIAEVIQVTGEFTWRVKRGETNRVVDYVAPPLMLSSEATSNDLNWSQGCYATPESIAAAFKLPNALPEPIGVYANQPNPWADTTRRVWTLFLKLALVAIVVQSFFFFMSSEKTLLRQDFTFEPRSSDEVQSGEFTLAGKQRKLAVRQSTSLDNNWIGLDLLLVNKTTGQAWPAARELAYYWGYDDGRWTEGSRDDEVVFVNIPAGTYYLTIDPDMPPDKNVAVRDRLEVLTPRAGWSNFIIVMLFLAAFPIFATMRKAAFETRRWAESDHAPVSSDDSDGDD